MGSAEELLEQAGVDATTLAAGEREALDGSGFALFERLAEPAWLEAARDAFEATVREAPEATGRQSGTRHIEQLDFEEPAFDRAYAHPTLLAAVHHVLHRPFKLLVFGGRDPLPGYGAQGLHTDWMPRTPGEAYSVVTAIWMLDEFTPDNGATRVVPGSHVVPRPLPKAMQAPASSHPDEVRVGGPAGSLLVFNGHLWHSGTRNDSQRPRRSLQLQFVACDRMRPGLERVVPERLGPLERFLLETP